MKKLISLVLVLLMTLSCMSVTTQAAKISPEGRTIAGWNNWSVTSGTAVTTRIDPASGSGRDEMVKVTAGSAAVSFDASYDGIVKLTAEVYGSGTVALCDADGTALASAVLANGLINETECAYNANAWNTLVIYALPAISSYDVYLYEGETHTKVLRGSMTVAGVSKLSFSSDATIYADNLKLEELEKKGQFSDEDLSEIFLSTDADGKGVDLTTNEQAEFSYRYGTFNDERVFVAEDKKWEEGTTTNSVKRSTTTFDTSQTESIVYSMDIYAASTHEATNKASITSTSYTDDNTARLELFDKAKGHVIARFWGGYFYVGSDKITAVNPGEDAWFNLRVEFVKEENKRYVYVTYIKDEETVISVYTDTMTSLNDFEGFDVSFNGRKNRHGIFYLKNISVSTFDDTEGALNTFSVSTDGWEDDIVRESVDELIINDVVFLAEDGVTEYSVPQKNGTVKSVSFTDYTGASNGKQLVVAIFDGGVLSGCSVIDVNGTGEYTLETALATKIDSVVKVFCWDKETLVPGTDEPRVINSDRHILDGKKVILIGNSFTYYGKTVIDGNQYVGDNIRTARFDDKGYFYQLCKQNGADVTVTNWTWGGHALNDTFGGSCAADRGHDGHDHLADLRANSDMDYDYVIIQPGSSDTAETLSAGIELIQGIFEKVNPDVKFVLNVHPRYYLRGTDGDKALIGSIDEIAEKYDLILANWGEIVSDIIDGTATVENATQEYNKNTFIVTKSATDGYHPNMLSGYITTQMLYSAITGEKATGEDYSFCTDTSVNSNFSVSNFLKSYYTYDNVSEDGTLTGDALTTFPEVFASQADMAGIQKLIDTYLNIQ